MIEGSFQGDTGDLLAVLRLSPMPSSTRIGTIGSVRAVRELLTSGPDLPVAAFEAAVASADAAMRAALGPRHNQILSDCRRALRDWGDEPRRTMAIRLRGRIPTLQDALAAAKAAWPEDKAHRAETAMQKLAGSEDTNVAGLDATAVVIEPLLRAASPETFGVEATKSLQNICGLVRAAVALVDPDRIRGREADVDALPADWKEAVRCLCERTPEHAKAERAIYRRLAATATRDRLGPSGLTEAFVERFIAREIVTKGPSHPEKLRAAARRWSQAVADGVIRSIPITVKTPARRLADVSWMRVPASIREPVDALLSQVRSPTAGFSWSSLVPGEEVDELDLELGLAEISRPAESNTDCLLREPGTVRNWRDAIKRVWHAARTDQRVAHKPDCVEDLFSKDCVLAAIRAMRAARRGRLEQQGKPWTGQEKGRYETSVIQAFVAVGRALGVADDRLAPIVALVPEIDPSVVAKKLKPDGTLKYVYDDRRIGPRHADMLRQFNEETALRRWFGAPQTLWRLAEAHSRSGGKPTLRHAALARSALMVQLCQRVSPLRRMNLARLRNSGEAPHIQLPVGEGEGEGWLVLPAIEVKNHRQIKVRLDPDTVAMIRRYTEVYRPVLAKDVGAAPENEHLFPGSSSERRERGPDGGYGPGLGYTSKENLAKTFAGHMRRYALLRMDLHVMRHLAAKVILDQDPSAMALVQELLGHKKIETTRAYYAEVCGLIAQDRYLALLDKATRKALSKVTFKIGLERDLMR